MHLSRFCCSRLLSVAMKEWLQLRRDTQTLGIILVLPVVMLVIYGYAISFDLRAIPLAVLDQDHTPASRVLVERFGNSQYFHLLGSVASEAQAADALEEGRVRFVLVIPARFGAEIAAGRPATLQALFDGSDSNTAGIALGYVTGAVQTEGQRILLEMADRRLPRAARRLADVQIRTQVLYNPALDSTTFVVPGLIAVILAMTAALLTSGTVARERERGTLEQLVASPIHPAELMLGKLVPYILISLADMLLVVLFGWVLFRIWPTGSLILLLGMTALFLPCTLGLGLLISTRARTQQMALLGAFMLTVLPSILLSGFAFSRLNMPPVLQAITHLVPAPHFLIIVRGFYLKGVGMAILWPHVVWIVGFGILFVMLSARGFRKRLD